MWSCSGNMPGQDHINIIIILSVQVICQYITQVICQNITVLNITTETYMNYNKYTYLPAFGICLHLAGIMFYDFYFYLVIIMFIILPCIKITLELDKDSD